MNITVTLLSKPPQTAVMATQPAYRFGAWMSATFFATLMVALGLVTLIGGGELLVRGASAIASTLRVPPLIIGLTVVAFGTSTPELGVSLHAAHSGVPDVAVGNVVGSNVFNVLFILGVSALITPLMVSSQLIRIDVPLMVAVSLLAWLLVSDGMLDRVEGSILFSVILMYVVMCIRMASRESGAVKNEFADEFDLPHISTTKTWLLQIGQIAIGLVLLGFGSRWFVDGSVSLASWFGMSQLVIGLTIVAAGTSLPEVVTSIIASARGERDIAVGNVVGSNLFNLTCVLGLSGVMTDGGMTISRQSIRFDFPVMIVVAALCLPIFFTGGRISRLEGGFLIVAFIAYTGYLIAR